MKKIGLLGISFMFILFGCSKKNSPYKRKDNHIYLGTYPQTLEKDEKKLEKLNKKITNLPTESNNFGWTSYKYYIEDEVVDFMYYIDIDLNNDETYDYRGVYFNRYRPFHTHMEDIETHANQLYNEYYINTVYFFKYETIKWDILEEKDDTLTLISSNLLDSQDYYPSFSRNLLDHDGVMVYANNYELSTIRKWLNEVFYETAFTGKEKGIIQKTLVNNSISKDDYIELYKSNDTLDNVYLLSNDEINIFYAEASDRKATSSDYANVEGLNQIGGFGCWQTRTPYSSNPNYTLLVTVSGTITHTEANSTYTGIRPVIVITL